MIAQNHTALDLTRRRVEAVAAVSTLTAKALKFIQTISGLEMDILRLELAIGRDPANGQLVQELRDVKQTADKMREAHADCTEEIAAAEQDVAALDRSIATAKGG
jgi:hypothetical protein